MRILLHKKMPFVFGALLLIGIALFGVFKVFHTEEITYTTHTLERGEVRSVVSVSGVVEARNAAELAFPQSDIVAEVLVREGDEVTENDLLLTQRQRTLQAEYADAEAALAIAIASRDELIAGARPEARDVSTQTVVNAKAALLRTITEEDQKVANAKRTLYSSNLEAVPERLTNNNTAPTISGTYLCEETGTYTLDIYRSGAKSNYSYQLGGLEYGSASAYTDAPAPLGSCGLYIQFDPDTAYADERWNIRVPNPEGATYTANLSAYELAQDSRDNAIAASKDALQLADRSTTLENADPRSESVRQADGAVLQARAALERIAARIEDRNLRAPFSGTITDVAVVPGESTGITPVVTMVANDAFTLSARIPEIDITKINEGNIVDVVFDAQTSDTLSGNVSFISPLAVEIDGVAYFEADITLEETPVWLRSGLNADIDIITNSAENVVRIPKRFLTTDTNDSGTVLIYENGLPTPKHVSIGLVGNDGFIELTDLPAGTEVIAP